MTHHPGTYRVIAGNSTLRILHDYRLADEYARDVRDGCHPNIGLVSLQRLNWEYDWETVENYPTAINFASPHKERRYPPMAWSGAGTPES